MHGFVFIGDIYDVLCIIYLYM